jgi:single-stranded-DNA-specific exonuclease
VRKLQENTGCSEPVAWILARRGITTVEAAQAWLDPIVHDVDSAVFHDPMLLGDMQAAVERIHYAIAEHQPIVVHGDYDADGVCSTTLLTEALEALGADVRPFLPSRFTNGYGLKLDSVERFALDGMRLLITVDCGITSVEEIAQAIDHGMDVIVCDHHQPGETIPPGIICSTRPSDYPFPDLCATAVAGKLVQALGAPYGDAQHELEAIATIADVVPLVGENREIVRRGLRALRRTERPGLRALLSTCDLHASEVAADDVAFRIAPRINAVGRLGEADSGYELLRAEHTETAERVAQHLHHTNDRRKKIEGSITAQAIEQVEGWTAQERAAKAYVVSGDGWHEGVVGIVASRLVEAFHRPVVVIGESDPLSRGSGRSVPNVDLHALLAQCSDLLVNWGGHSGAAGVTVDRAGIAAFRKRLEEVAAREIPDEALIPVEHVDAVIAGRDISLELAQELQQLAPFGHGNSRPNLLILGATVDGARTVGNDGSHLSCRVVSDNRPVKAIAFRQAEHLSHLSSGALVDMASTLSINKFRGAETLQLEVQRIFPAIDGDAPVLGMCATSCTFECRDRIPFATVLQQVAAGASDTEVGFDPSSLEELAKRPHVTDLRDRVSGLAHISRMATNGRSLLVVCADVSRRRSLLTGRLHPARLGMAGAMLASERCNPLGVAARLKRMADVRGPVFALCDYGALEECLGSGRFDTLVVLDPPTQTDHFDLLLQGSGDTPVHLSFGVNETQFSQAAHDAARDARETLRGSWKEMKSQGSLAGEQLERVLFGDGPHLHTPAAVTRALVELERRQLVTIDPSDAALTVAAE